MTLFPKTKTAFLYKHSVQAPDKKSGRHAFIFAYRPTVILVVHCIFAFSACSSQILYTLDISCQFGYIGHIHNIIFVNICDRLLIIVKLLYTL